MGTSRTMVIYVVRHGMTQANLEKRYLGHKDEPLLPEKIDDLYVLKQELEKVSFEAFFSSDLTRCLQTLCYLYPDRPICVDSRLRELSFGEWERSSHEELQHELSYQKWISNWKSTAPPKGERFTDFQERIQTFMDELLQTSLQTVLILTHGGVIRSLYQHFHPAQSMWAIQVPHGGGFRMILEKQEEWICTSWSGVPTQEKGKSFVSGTEL